MDNLIFMYLYNLGQKNKGFYKFFFLITKASSYIYFLLYFSLLVHTFYNNKNRFGKFIIVPFLTLTSSIIIRNVVKRKRPLAKFNILKKSSYCFPSNHTSSSLIISILFLYTNYYFGVTLISLSIFIAISRVVTGFHYPSDIFFGLVLGAFFGLFINS